MIDQAGKSRRVSVAEIRPVLMLLLLSAVPASFAQQRTTTPLPTLAPMIESTSPAVVNISVRGRIEIDSPLSDDPLFRRFFGGPRDNRRDFRSAGSGVIVDAERGYILTNHHVVENAAEITITLLDSRGMQAQVIGSDAQSDLAVLQVEADSLVEMPFADSGGLSVGDFVVAIGNPFGFSHTVTSGIVSGLGRSGVNPDINAYEDFIQTDASINPGNSGGALVNLNGELVGVNSAIVSRTGGNIGIGFAIPANMARSVMEQLIAHGQVNRGLLGVNISSLSAELAEFYGLPDTSGALVTGVSPGDAAEEAGIEIHDVIVSVNGESVRDSRALRNLIGLLMPGETVRVGFIRDGREDTVTAVLTPVEPTFTRAPPAPLEVEPVLDGIELVSAEASDGVDGLLLTGVEPGSPAFAAGLRVGDIITHINRERVRDIDEALEVAGEAWSMVLQIERDNRSRLIPVR